MVRSASRGLALILGSTAALLALAACQGGAAAVSPPAEPWRAAATFKVAAGQQVVGGSVTALSGGSAWATVSAATSPGHLTEDIERRNGHGWQRLSLPAAVARQWASNDLGGAAVAASSASNVWVIGGEALGIRYAHYTGRWSFGAVPGTAPGKHPKHITLVADTEVVSPNDVWIFGFRLSTGAAAAGTPFAAHFNGQRWSSVAVPGSGAIVAVTVISAHDILALVGSDEFLGFGTSTPTVIRWNGTSWRPLPVQPARVPGGTNVTAMTLSDGHLWIGGDRRETGAGLMPVYSNFAAELAGSSWRTVTLPAGKSSTDFELASLVPDGSGGLWALGASTASGISQRLWHYVHGRWQAPEQPRFGGTAGHLTELAAVPGSGTVWGAGTLQRDGTVEGLIALVGPQPR